MKRWLLIAVSIALAAIVGLAFVFPHEMVSPGDLIPAHAALKEDCFACHTPFRGASAQRCMACHKIADIGLRTTKGVALAQSSKRPPFHQALLTSNCLACHTDHPPPLLSPAGTVMAFDHSLLRPDMRGQCQACHVAPRDAQHQGKILPCAECHQNKAWKPSTFDHDRYFRLDRHHRVACVTCHLGGQYQRYTCYGCHAHREDRIVAEHREEGIRDIDDCVRCHKSPDGHVGERGSEGQEDDD
ncbi:MAG: class III cytochrome C family protein [Alphaproteobacteria bacterium]|nr:MAG: class III cytochrome C family protein [Alphaproteobacteria bacterium]